MGRMRLDPKAASKAVRNYARTRPYHLLPWVVLTAAVALWPPRRDSAPGLSEDRSMSPLAFDRDEPGRGRAAEWPHHIPLLGWRDVLWRVYRETMRDRIPIVAGGITFHALLALFPALGAFASLYGLFNDISTVQRQLQDLAVVFPSSVVQLIGEQMLRLAGQHGAKLSIAFIVSLAISIWSANAGMKVLLDGLNITYDEMEKRDFFRRTAMTYAATFALLLFLVVISGLLVAAPIVARALGLAPANTWWFALRWIVVYGVTVTAFAFAYRYGPSRRRAKWRWVMWGAVFSSTFWLGGSLAFSWYINNVANLDATYGPLGAVMAFMLWVWLSVIVLLLGAELNAEIEHQTAVDTTHGRIERPMGERGAVMADTVGRPLPMTPKEAAKWAGSFIVRQVRTLARITGLSANSPRAKRGGPPGPRR